MSLYKNLSLKTEKTLTSALERIKINADIILSKRDLKLLNSSLKKLSSMNSNTPKHHLNKNLLKSNSEPGVYVQHKKEELKNERRSSLNKNYPFKEEKISRVIVNKCSICDCHSSNKLLAIPTCWHKFCENCFKNDLKVKCWECVKFFKSDEDKSSQKFKLCYLCTNTVSIMTYNCKIIHIVNPALIF